MTSKSWTIMEIAAVLLPEWLARGLRTSEKEWLPRHLAETAAMEERAAAKAVFVQWQARVKELEQSIAGKITFVEDRHNRNIHLPEFEAVAIKAVVDGYNAGIAENIGRLRGVPYLPGRA